MATRPRDWFLENDPPEARFNLVRDPEIWSGVALVAKTRIPVFMLVDLFKETGKVEDVIDAYPRLTVADVHNALEYARAFSDSVGRDREAHERAVEAALRG
jgi:uncharacterized protein (DUF433 family)